VFLYFVRNVNIDELCEQQPDVILICSSILATEPMVRRIPFNKLKPDTIFVDVLSVKQFPQNLFLEVFNNLVIQNISQF
jgi:arogenate dehydrogenase (NADP+)